MKKSIEVIGLPVISISEGKELGCVKRFLINPSEGAVAGIVIDDGKWYLGAKVLPFSAITGIGEYAVTVETSEQVVSVAASPQFEALFSQDVSIIGTKVLTKSGRIQGKTLEFIIDEAGKIIICEVEEANGDISHISAQQILTYGKDVLIVTGNNETSVPNPKAAAVDFPDLPVKTAVKDDIAAEASASDDASKKFDEKQRKYLLGKKSSRRIETDNGMVIVEQGGEITEEVLQKAKLAGKFVELSMNI